MKQHIPSRLSTKDQEALEIAMLWFRRSNAIEKADGDLLAGTDDVVDMSYMFAPIGGGALGERNRFQKFKLHILPKLTPLDIQHLRAFEDEPELYVELWLKERNEAIRKGRKHA